MASIGFSSSCIWTNHLFSIKKKTHNTAKKITSFPVKEQVIYIHLLIVSLLFNNYALFSSFYIQLI